MLAVQAHPVSAFVSYELATGSLRFSTGMDVLRGDRVSLRELDADNRSLFADRFVGDYDAFTMLWGLPPHPSAKAAGAHQS